MFNEKYGLTAAVLAGTKTQTRRLVPDKLLSRYGHNKFNDRSTDLISDAPFNVGEVVAVAQNYNEVYSYYRQHNENVCAVMNGRFGQFHKGWTNKMFVESLFMPHQIEITNIRVERLQDISDEDCLAEGIIKYTNGVYTYIEDGKKIYRAKLGTPRMAYADLIDKISGKGTWKRNPWVFVYTFSNSDSNKEV